MSAEVGGRRPRQGQQDPQRNNKSENASSGSSPQISFNKSSVNGLVARKFESRGEWVVPPGIPEGEAHSRADWFHYTA